VAANPDGKSGESDGTRDETSDVNAGTSANKIAKTVATTDKIATVSFKGGKIAESGDGLT